tara:strand:+ start:327 stop:989 length:663 start_codon:yes stop_codon:yes gene_type:complete
VSRSLSTVADVLELDEIFPFFAIELMFDERKTVFAGSVIQAGPLYLWTGLGDLVVGSTTYSGTGNMLQISEVTETADLRAAGATITLSGVPSETVSLALQEPYHGRECRIKFGILDANQNKTLNEDGEAILLEDTSDIDNSVGTVSLLIDLFTGYMDVMDITEDPETCVIALKVENKLIDLQTRKTRRYTSEYQKNLFPNDNAFDYLNDLQTKRMTWGGE